MRTPQNLKRETPDFAPTRDPASEAEDLTRTRAGNFTPAEEGALPTIPGYEVLGELGRGGIGIVYMARQIALNRVVAVKLIGGTASTTTLLRFRQEAEAVAKLQHPNIIQVFEVGSCPAGSYLTLEYVDGGTLREKVAGVPYPPRDAARTVETLARAVHHAHERRLIHRDLKPQNVLLTASGVPKIADFGLARSLDTGAGGVTMTVDFVGTPAYAAPEQAAARFGAVGPTTDVYALGVILYELLVGRVPFDSGSIPEVLRMVTDSEPVPPRRLRPDVPRDLETICLKCLRKESAKRYATAAALADDLHHFLAGEPITARPIGVLERTVRWAKRNPSVATLLGTVAALLTAVAVVATVAAVRIDDARRKADTNALVAKQAAEDSDRDRVAAERAALDGKEKLLQSLVSEAKASRYSRRIGQRFNTLDAVRKATALARELGKPPATFDELRNLAIAALALPDMKPDAVWFSRPTDIDNTWAWPIPDPDYRRGAIVNQRGDISLRRFGTGPDDCGEIARFKSLGSEVAVVWSADGRYLAAYHWNIRRVQLRRVDGPQPELILDLPKDCLGLVFTPDSRQLIVIEVNQPPRGSTVAQMYDAATGKPGRSVALPGGSHGAVAHHPRRSELAVRNAGGVSIIDLTSGKQTAFLPVGSADHLAWHPHGELLAVTTPHAAEIWDVRNRRRNWRLEHTGGGVQISFNRAGDLAATTGWSGRVRLWNPYAGREVLTAIGWGLFGPDDRLAVRFPSHPADSPHPLTVVEAGREYRTLPLGVGRVGVNELMPPALHPGGRLAAVPTAVGFSLLDLTSGTERAFIPAQGGRAAMFDRDGALLVSTNQGLYRLPVGADRENPNRLNVGPPEVVPVGGRGETLGQSADGDVLACPGGSGDRGGVVWRRDRPYDSLELPHADCRHMSISPDGKLAATGSWSGRGIRVWDTETGRLVRTLVPDEGATIPTFSPDGRWLTESRGKRWRVADWSEGPRPAAGVEGWRYSPDGRLAGWSGKGFVVLVDPASGRELARLEDPHQDGIGFVFSRDGSLVIGSTNDSFCVRVWDLRKIRAGLVELGLDWDAPPYPPAAPTDYGAPPLDVRLVGLNTFSPVMLATVQRERALLALSVNPLDADARLSLGDWLLARGRISEASAQFAAAVALRPDQTGAYRLRALARFRMLDMEGCIADVNAVLAKRPDDYPQRGQRRWALIRLGRPADAIPDIDALLEVYPDDLDLYLQRIDGYRALGQTEKVVADWKTIAERIGPASGSKVLNDAAWLLLAGPEAIRDAKRALELAKQADGIQPNSASILNTLGLALYRNGLWKEAIEPLERALRTSRLYDAHHLFVLSMCHARLGDGRAARDCYRRAEAWVAARPKLQPDLVAELATLRREADAVLRAAGFGPALAPPPREK